MPQSIFYADKVQFDYKIHQLWWDLLDGNTGYRFTDALAPKLCSDWETERRKNDLVQYLVAADAQGINLVTLPDYTLCGTFITE